MTFATFVNNLVALGNSTIIPLMYALAFLYFVAGVAFFVFTGNQENRKKARDMMLYGLIGLFIIFAVWGLVNVVLTTLNSAI